MSGSVDLGDLCTGDKFRIDDGETIVLFTTVYDAEGPGVTITYRPPHAPQIVNTRHIEDISKVKFTRM